jgi:TPR repeat protein
MRSLYKLLLLALFSTAATNYSNAAPGDKVQTCMQQLRIKRIAEVEAELADGKILNTEQKGKYQLALFNIYSRAKINKDIADLLLDGKQQACNICRPGGCKIEDSFSLDSEPNDFVIIDKKKGIQYLIKSSDSGYVPAISELANQYLKGNLFPKNMTSALQNAVKAAKQGDTHAQLLASAIYGNFDWYDQDGTYDTKGADKNLVLAYVWATIAKVNGENVTPIY